jgi:MinD superfamily P-loop ATPase
MPLNKKIAFYSTVPGSGSSLMSVGFARFLADRVPGNVSLASFDYKYSAFTGTSYPSHSTQGPLTVFLPSIDWDHCNLCKTCARHCVFGAIRIDSALSYITLKAERCRACGACINTCRYGAIRERERVIGIWKQFSLNDKIDYYESQLLAEEFFATKLLIEFKKMLPAEGYCIVDAFGGLNYPAMESLHMADVVVLITDPSTFNESYYHHVLGILGDYQEKVIAVVNYRDQSRDEISEFFSKKGILYLNGFPDLGLIRGNPLTNASVYPFPDYYTVMEAIYIAILKKE